VLKAVATKAEVLLTHSNNLYSDRKQVEKMQPYPPLQTILAAAVLREQGIATALFDPTDRCNPRMVVVCEDDFNFLSKMCLTCNRDLAFRMAEIARGRGIVAAVHGSDASDRVSEYLAAGFSFVLVGEVETTLVELASGQPAGTIRGLAFHEGGTLRHTHPREVNSNLDALPSPAWDLVDIERYRQAWVGAHTFFQLNMASSRGCPYRCNWCAKPIYGQSWHSRAAASVAAELLHLKTAFAPNRIWFADDIFGLSPKWITQFAEAVEDLDAQIPFKMQSRCDLMTRNSVAALKRAGCAEVWMGCESGSQKILDAMEKGIRVGQIYEARENLRREGIRACFFLQFGYPGERWAEIEATIRMVRETAPDDIGVSVSYPLPGTRFHRDVLTRIGSAPNWSDSADLAMVFEGAYPSDFYRALADALHLEVRGGEHLSAAWERVYRLEQRAGVAEAVA
jgi:anaerobic magnesium-protoporphyrin IX monomethyl ester cyclase